MDKERIKKVTIVVEYEDGSTFNVLEEDLTHIDLKYTLKYDIKHTFDHGYFAVDVEHTGRIDLNLNLTAWVDPQKK